MPAPRLCRIEAGCHRYHRHGLAARSKRLAGADRGWPRLAGAEAGSSLRSMPPSYRALALRMWLSSVVFPAPRKPVRMVTGTRPSSFGSTSIGAIGEVVRHAGGCRGMGASRWAVVPSRQTRSTLRVKRGEWKRAVLFEIPSIVLAPILPEIDLLVSTQLLEVGSH